MKGVVSVKVNVPVRGITTTEVTEPIKFSDASQSMEVPEAVRNCRFQPVSSIVSPRVLPATGVRVPEV